MHGGGASRSQLGAGGQAAHGCGGVTRSLETSREGALHHGEESGVVGGDVLTALGFGVHKLAIALRFLLTLVDGDLEAASRTVVSVEVVGELAGLGLFDLLDRGNSLGAVASAAAVVDAHGVGRIISLLDDLGSSLSDRHIV